MALARTERLVGGAVVAAAVIATAVVYPELPGEMAIHWDAGGEADDTASKAVGAWLLPGLAVVLAALLYAVPRIDPLGENFDAFRDTYEWFVAGVLALLTYVHGYVLLWNLGYEFSIVVALVPALAAVYYATGVLLARAEPNWFVGIRTPWTLSDDAVWRATHDRGAVAFKLAGALALGGLVVPEYAIAFLVGPAALASLYLVGFSFVAYRRRERV